MRGVLAAAAVALASTAAPADELRDLCPDRPGKGTSPCTVDAGHLQAEIELLNGAEQRFEGVTTDTIVLPNPTVKYGLSDNLELGADLAPFVMVRTHDGNAGVTQTLRGVGDLVLRAKLNLIGNAGGDLSVALDPFVKLPTARVGIGNGAVEGGLLVPLALDLGSGWSLGATPELDLNKNATSAGYHPGLVGVVGLGRTLANGITLGAELWSSSDLDPAATTQRYSFDLVAAWKPANDPDLQLDCGVNLGLNRVTPRWQTYLGVTRRF